MKRPPLGQHFLRCPTVLDQLVTAIAPAAGDTFVEVGPGHGQLTRPLLEAGATVVAIERDRRLAASLPTRLAGLSRRLQVVAGDAAKSLPVPPTGPWRLVGNLPYAISSPLLAGLLGRHERLVSVHVMLQLEFANRLAAQPGSRAYGRLTVAIQSRFAVRWLFAVPPESFAPPPNVESAVVCLHPLPVPAGLVDALMFDKVTKLAFAQRRKRLDNALAGLGMELPSKFAGLRAENLSVADYVMLANQAARLAVP